MFTGLVEEQGRIISVSPNEAGARIEIGAHAVLDGLALGDSVAVNGACLTAVTIDADRFAVDAVAETLRRTALGRLRAGETVNLERALVAGDRLDGHIVQGHIDGTGRVRSVRPEGESAIVEITAAPDLLRYIVEKGSIAVDGISLTVAGRTADAFTVALIPHTMRATTLGPQAQGRTVNLEVDVLAKYVAALAEPYMRQSTDRR
ncbi:MAG TPA: riboflavin synthase [Miltoncostaeaceae bacterium]|nr:riboflavin synthase [Miltoncostaeaceae bacterium]